MGVVPMKLAIIGSRNFNDWFKLQRVLKPYLKLSCSNMTEWWIEEVVSGGARGADKLGAQWAKANNLKLKEFPADWEKHGKRAGFLRNTEIADYADVCIAFWDMQSRGTADTIDKFRERGKSVIIIPIGDYPCQRGRPNEHPGEGNA